MTTNCEYCARDSGIYDHKRKCCQLRQIAAMPVDRRQRYYDQVQREQGKEAANALIADVNKLRQAKRVAKLEAMKGEGKA